MSKQLPQKIKVLHFLERIRIGGPGRSLIDLLRNIDSTEFKSAICVLEKTENYFTDEIDKLKVPVYIINKKNINDILFNFNPDVLHVHSTGSKKLIEICYVIRYSPPIIQTILTWSKFFPVSVAVRKIVLTTKSLVSLQPKDERISIINNSIDLKYFRIRSARDKARRLLGIDDASIVVGMVCRFVQTKVDLESLDVFIEIVKRRPNVKVIFVGDYDKCIEDFQDKINALGLKNNFVITGEREDVSELYEAMDLLIHVPHSECFGLVVLEAMAKGLPVVARDVGGIKDIINDGENGILKKDLKDIVNESVKLIDSQAERKRLKRNGLLRVKSFDIKKTSAQYANLYKKLNKEPPHRLFTIPKNIEIDNFFANKKPTVKGLISIVVPVFNDGEFIADCLESIFSQTYRKFEVIVVDDGSSDKAQSVLDKYLFDQRLKIIHKPRNTGVAETVNMGFRFASGEYFTRVDADDIVFKNWLKTLLSYLKKDKSCGLVFSDMAYFGRITGVSRRTFSSDRLFFKKPHISLGHIIRREVVECVGGYNPAFLFCEDFDLNLRIDEQFKIAHIPVVLYKARFHGQSSAFVHGKSFGDFDLKDREESLVRRGILEINEDNRYE